MTFRWYTLTLVAMACGPLACSSSPSPNTVTPDDNQPQVVVDEDVIIADPGSGFDDAPRLLFDAANRMVVDNAIAMQDEVHVYNVGALDMGDALEVIAIDKDAVGFDPMIALFDADGYRAFWNDDVNPETGNFSAFFSGSIRHSSPAYYLAIASSNFSTTTGTYRMTVQRRPGLAIVPIKGQTVVLQWEAVDDVIIRGVPYGDLDPAEADAISALFAGRTEELRTSVLGFVRKDFAPYDITVVSSDEDPPVDNFTQVFFGSEAPADFISAKIFGSSDGIDFYNGSDQDNAIVFLGPFGGLTSDFEAIVQAVANVVSHEIGHTLGLMHTADATKLMDTAGQDATLLDDQGFGTAVLFDFPIGLQNADMLLEETVGRVPTMLAGDDGQLYCGTCGASLFKVHGRHID